MEAAVFIVLLLFLAVWLALGYFGWRIMVGKGRSGVGGVLLGLLLGLLGLIIALLMRPTAAAEAARQMEIEVKKQEAIDRARRGRS